MMSEFLAFLRLGFGHIVTAGALDHILFLAVLAVVYRARDWRDALWVVSAFTVGHSVTLALAVTHTLRMSEPVVEFLIPLTIVATAVENLLVRDRGGARHARVYRPCLAGYLESLFVERIAVPLVGFNVGIEVGQILVLVAIGAALTSVDAIVRRAQRASLVPRAMPVHRLRVVGLSMMIGFVAAVWAVERRPW